MIGCTKTSFNTIRQAIDSSKIKLCEEIQQLPDNPDIERISESVKCFIIKSSNLSRNTNLTPFYYDFKVQYQRIIEEIKKRTFEKVIEFMNGIIQKGYFRDSSSKYICTFHPVVVGYLKKIWGS